jgi:hypothetical protein
MERFYWTNIVNLDHIRYIFSGLHLLSGRPLFLQRLHLGQQFQQRLGKQGLSCPVLRVRESCNQPP